MRSLNKVLLVGNLTRDPDVTEMEGGIKVGRFVLATNRNWTTRDGEKKEQADFHNIVVWRKLAELCAAHLKKGSAVLVEGTLKNSQFTGRDGEQKKLTEVHAEEVNFITYRRDRDQDQISLVTVEEEK
jgi:single-strand DNA-binding protein